MEGLTSLTWAAIAFVGSHFVLSHPLRAPLVGAIGERGFAIAYSLVALATFGWVAEAFRHAPSQPWLWPVGDGLWAVVTLVMLIALVLLMGSLVRNPAFPTGGTPGALPAAARGAFAVTRHPMMWAFALWAVCHLAVFPIPANVVLTAAILVLALVGAALQDRKKERLEPDRWRAWEAKTSYWPFAAIAAGRARFGGFGMHALAGGVGVWLVATCAHIPLVHWPAGIWRWIV